LNVTFLGLLGLATACGQDAELGHEQRSFDEMLTSKAVCDSACANLNTVCGVAPIQCSAQCFTLPTDQQSCLAGATTCEDARVCTSHRASEPLPNS
jgi:hypothetical protein